jgi:putative transposase
MRNDADFARHVDYVQFNLLKHGLVGAAWDWPFSSFRRAVAREEHPSNWRGAEDGTGEFGERLRGRSCPKMVGC